MQPSLVYIQHNVYRVHRIRAAIYKGKDRVDATTRMNVYILYTEYRVNHL